MRPLWWLLAQFVAIKPVANWLIKRAQKTPYIPISSPDGKVVYMDRFWLFNPYFTQAEKDVFAAAGKSVPWKFPLSVRIHCIRTPDADRAPHDHPWNCRSIILRGSYLEAREGKYRVYETGDTSKLRFGKDFHRIESVLPDLGEPGVWTMFITGRFQGTWGFKVAGVKIPFKTYLRDTGDANMQSIYKEPK